MPLYLSRPGGKMKGLSVLRTLGKRLAPTAGVKTEGRAASGQNTVHTVIDFSVTERCREKRQEKRS